MRVLPSLLAKLAPSLADVDPALLAETLTLLGFETELLPGETPVLDVNITPNRGDAMSHLGLARELVAYRTRTHARRPAPLHLTAAGTLEALPALTTPALAIEPPELVTQYHLVLLENVSVGPSPEWLQRELTLLGIRPISNIVDVTNYLMELYGQPLHAFDADALLGETLTVRESRAGESLTTLDGTEHTLPDGALVIADREGLVDLAGIQGGANSEVRLTTSRVLLQSAIFDTGRIRRGANTLNHRTPASARYERGVDATISYAVLEEAIALLGSKPFGRAKAVGALLIGAKPSPKSPLPVDAQRVDRLLGFATAADTQRAHLAALGCAVTPVSKHTYEVIAPSWRFDLAYWQDVAEEIARFAGLNDTVPTKRLRTWEGSQPRSEYEWAEGIKDRLVELGLSEVQTYSFIGQSDLGRFGLPVTGELANPLNPTLRFLRPSLLPGLTRVIAANSAFDPVQVFEIGHVFTPAGETTNLAIALAGNTLPAQAWLAQFADRIGLDSGALTAQASVIELTAELLQQYKIRRKRVTLIELPLTALTAARRIPTNPFIPSIVQSYRPLSKYPPVTRDIALLVPRTTDAAAVRTFIAGFHESIELVELFDEFSSDKLGPDRKSIAYHVYYSHPERTLTETDINDVHTGLERALAASFGAEIR